LSGLALTGWPDNQHAIYIRIHGLGVTLPNTTARRAPVTLGTFDGAPSNVAAPSKANATASLASPLMP
jgi:hypothetical protein